MKTRTYIITGTVAAAAILLLAIKPFGVKEKDYVIETVKVERGLITNPVKASGTIEAITTVDVGTQVSGIIKNVYVDFNDNVKEGQVLAKIDETNLLEQLKQSQAGLDQAQAQLNYQQATFSRIKALYEKQLVAESEYDQALFNLENSKASVVNARSAVSRAKVNLDYATITSPIEGVVLNRAVEEGQTVAASFNTPTLFTIVNDLTQMEVQTNVDEADIGKVQEGQAVEFTVDAYPGLKFTGSVSQVRLQPVTTNNVVTYVVILNAPNPDKKLMPGMTASAIIFSERKEDALILSAKAVRFNPPKDYKNVPDGGIGQKGEAKQVTGTAMKAAMTEKMTGSATADTRNRTVWLKDGDNGIKPVVITLGIDNGSTVEVTGGLGEGDEVVISMNSSHGSEPAPSTTSPRPAGPMPF